MSNTSLGTIRGTIKIDYDGKGVLKAEDDIETLGKKSEKSKVQLDKLAKGFALAGGVIAGGFAVASKSAIDFEKRLSAIKAVSGATQGEMDALRAKALQLGKDTVFSASESAAAMEELVKAGLSVSDVLNGAADATVALAAAGEVDLPQAATIASNAMNQFALGAKDLPKVADLIAGAANASAIDVSEFGFSLAQVGAVAHLAGQSFDDTAVAIAELGNAGIKGSDAGTSLKTFLSNLVPTTDKAKTAMEQLGIVTKDGANKFLDAQGNFKSLRDISEVLNQSLKGLSESQKQVALETIFGSDAIRAASVLAGSGAKSFDELKKSMAGMTAADVAATRLDNTAGSIEQLKGSIDTLAITVGTLLIPRINKMIGYIQKAVDWFNGLSDTSKNTIINLAAIAATLLGVLAAGIKIYQFVKAVQALALAIKLWTVWSKIAAIATKAWAAVQWLLNVAMDANPVGLIILAIIALVGVIVLLWKKSDTFRKIVMGAWQGILTAVKAVVGWFQKNVLPVLKTVWQGIATGFSWLWGILKKVWDFIVKGVEGWIMVFKWAWNIVGPLVKALFGLIMTVVKTAWSVVSAIFSVWLTVTKAVFGAIWSVISTVWNAIWGVISWVVKLVWGAIVFYFNLIKNAISAAWNWILGVTKPVWLWIQGIIAKVLAWIMPYVAQAVAFVQKVVGGAWNWIKDTSSNVWNAIVGFVVGAWNWIVNKVKEAVARVVAIIDGIKAMVQKIKDFFDRLKTAASGGVGSLIDFVKGIPSKIMDALGNVGSMLYDSGKKIIQGLIDGIGSMIGKLKDKGKEALSGLRDLFPFSPAKEGPFSGKGWTLYSGMAIMEDFARGIDRNAMAPTSSAYASLAGTAATMAPGSSTTSTTTSNTRTLTINRVDLKGVIDPTDPASARQVIASLYKALDDYEKEYK